MDRKVIGVVGPKNMPIGEDHHNAKLTDEEVERIRDMHDGGLGYRRIARELGVHRSTVRDICTMRRRACTPDSYKTVKIKDLPRSRRRSMITAIWFKTFPRARTRTRRRTPRRGS